MFSLMNILFLHQNFPAQFTHLAPALARQGHRVFALTSRAKKRGEWNGVTLLPYTFSANGNEDVHPWVRGTASAVDRGAAVFLEARRLKARGLEPEVIVAHSGWGEAMYLRHVWPDARIGIFSEYYYQAEGADIGFDPEFDSAGEIGRSARVEMKNLPLRLQAESADSIIAPTRWQADLHPEDLRDRIDVIFDGIDTDTVRPDPEACLLLDGHGTFTRDEEVLTFVNRNLEPYRGFHVFMRALPDLLRRRPQAKVVIVGEDGVSYGTAPDGGGTWKQKLLAEVGRSIPDQDWSRIHFTGRIDRDQFTRLLQVSTVHVYLTYPFVLSWSLIEAMSAGCAIVGSDTAPLREAITDGETGLLFDFFDGAAMVDRIELLAENPALRTRLGAAARKRSVETYDLSRICLPAQFEWVEALAQR